MINKKHICILACVLLAIICYYWWNVSTYTGTKRIYFDSGTYCDVPYINGIRSGKVLGYSEQGVKVQECSYVEGKAEGLLTRWSRSRKTLEAEYHNGQQNGYHKVWDLSGKLTQHEFFLDGLRHGPQRLAFYNGSNGDFIQYDVNYFAYGRFLLKDEYLLLANIDKSLPQFPWVNEFPPNTPLSKYQEKQISLLKRERALITPEKLVGANKENMREFFENLMRGLYTVSESKRATKKWDDQSLYD